MSITPFTANQISKAIKKYESGKRVVDICHELGISRSTFYNWKKKYSGMDSTMLSKLKHLEKENARLKQMLTDLNLDPRILEALRENVL